MHLKPRENVTQGLILQVLNISDSRCPSGVTCVWAGQANVTLQSYSNNTKNIFSLVDSSNNSVTVDNYLIQLVSVDPYPKAGKKILLSEYIVTLKLNPKSDKLSLLTDSKKCLAGVDTCVMAQMRHLSPTKQIKVGIGALDVTCNDGYQLALKAADNKPSCLKSSTLDALILRGWALGHEEFAKLKMTFEPEATK